MSSPFSITFNSKNPIKPKDMPKQVTGAESTEAIKPMSESEEKLMKATQSCGVRIVPRISCVVRLH